MCVCLCCCVVAWSLAIHAHDTEKPAQLIFLKAVKAKALGLRGPEWSWPGLKILLHFICKIYEGQTGSVGQGYCFYGILLPGSV